MPLTDAQVDEFSGALTKVAETRTPVTYVTETFPEITVAEAYAIQLRSLQTRLENSKVVVGRKIGLSSRANQEMFGIDQPAYGHLFESAMVPEGDLVSMGRLFHPVIEPEICFVLEDDLKGPGVDVAKVLAATAGVMPAIEIADSRYKGGWGGLKAQDLIADNCGAAMVVLGGRLTPVADINLRLVGMVLEVNGEVVATGAGASVLAAEALSTRNKYQKLEHERREQLNQVIEENRALQTDTLDEQLIRRLVTKLTVQIENDERLSEPFQQRLIAKLEAAQDWFDGIGTLESKLQMVIRVRGHVWRNVRRTRDVNTKTGEVSVVFPPPMEGEEQIGTTGIDQDMVLFVFEEGPSNPQNPSQGAQYIGKFQVIDVAENGIKMAPILIHSWTDRQMKRLAGSDRTWSLYEMMPADRHDLFAFSDLAPEERRARLERMFPRGSEVYVRDGQPATADDPAANKAPYSKDGRLLSKDEAAEAEAGEVDWLYVRTLHDYEATFSELHHQWVLMKADLAGVQQDTRQLAEIIQGAKQDLALRRQEEQDTKQDLAGFKRDRQAITQHLEIVERKLSAVTAQLERSLSESSRLASQIAAAQLKIIQAIHGQTVAP